jgi:RNA polymerase sigma-70 factor (ECF subfamily)
MSRHLSDIEDQLLVMDAQVGDTEAMEKLVGRWQKRLWFYAYHLTRNKEAAWDITQEAWLGIIKGLRQLHDPANFKAWAYKITTNKSINWIKKCKANKHISIEETRVHQRNANNDTGVKEFLQKLDVRKRVVLSLYYFEELNISEISIALKIPKGTVKSRLHSARIELKKLWERHFE